MNKEVTKTRFVSRGRLAGLVRDEAPAGTGQNRSTQPRERESELCGDEEALFFRARLLLDEPLPRRRR
ncbi:MAG TPA: hypothetical protein VFN82_03845 [Solirubrobacterales bacterium]|nr:hypothetical protein [Solirubrobacterales bacterium]